MKKAKVEFNLTVNVLKEGQKFIAFSPALDLSTSGDSHKEVKKRFEEIVDIFFEEIIKKRTLGSVLQNLGWKRRKKEWVPPLVVSRESHKVRVPAR